MGKTDKQGLSTIFIEAVSEEALTIDFSAVRYI